MRYKGNPGIEIISQEENLVRIKVDGKEYILPINHYLGPFNNISYVKLPDGTIVNLCSKYQMKKSTTG
ncbi:MAG: hypothetical protein QXZ43_02930 [Candidatus Aenigmatarchaeota archaeon]